MDAGTERALAGLHRAVVDRPEDAIPWDALDATALDATAREAASAVWASRATAELQSMRVMVALASRALDAGLPLDATTSLARLAQDEARHATLCARMADALGGQGARSLEGVSCAATDDGLPAGLFFAKWTLSLLCVGESASLAMLGALRRRATDPCARAVVAAILRDEVVHERVGWELAARIVRTLTPSERGWLTGEISASFAHYASIHAGGSDPIPTEARPSTNAHAINVGMLPIERSARAFHGRVARVIVPRLEAIGLDARRAWAVSARAR